MKTLPSFWAVLAISLFIGCSSDSGEGAGVPEPQGLCPNATGPTGIYWEFAHSIPAPLTQVPVINNPGGQFVHSQHPLIGFIYPQGFTAFELTDPATGTLGVNLLRNDNQVVFRYIPNTQASGQIPATAILAGEINGMFAHYGFTGTPEVLCSTTSDSSAGGIPAQLTARNHRPDLGTFHVYGGRDLFLHFDHQRTQQRIPGTGDGNISSDQLPIVHRQGRQFCGQ